MKNLLLKLSSVLFVGMAGLLIYNVDLPKVDLPLASTTYYSDEYQRTPNGITMYRNKYVTTYLGSSTNLGTRQILGTLTNTENVGKNMSGTYSETTNRTYSLSFSVPLKVLEQAVSATIGNSVSYSRTVSLTGSMYVKAKSSANLYFRKNTQISMYTTVDQVQSCIGGGSGGNWENNGSSSTYNSSVSTLYPELIA